MTLQKACALALAVLIAGCSSVPQVPLAADARQRIHRIAVVQTPEPERYFLQPSRLPGGYALLLFGPVGGLVRRGMESQRTDSATAAFDAGLSPLRPAVGALWTDTVAKAVQSRGYIVGRVPGLPAPADGEALDCSALAGRYDAVLVSEVAAGYTESSAMEPRVEATVRLLSGDCSQTLYVGSFLYGDRRAGDLTFVPRDQAFAFPSREALLANPTRSKAALQAGTTALARRLADAL